MGIADRLDAQGEIVLAGDVRYFATHLPAVRTDRERIAEGFIRHLKSLSEKPHREERVRERDVEIAR